MIRHGLGTMDVEGSSLVVHLGGIRGVVRRRPWSRVESYALADILGIEIVGVAQPRVSVWTTASVEMAENAYACESQEDVSSLIADLLARNPAIRVTRGIGSYLAAGPPVVVLAPRPRVLSCGTCGAPNPPGCDQCRYCQAWVA